jgi:hypothetical protein
MACHGSTRPAGELSLAAGESYGALVNVPSRGCPDARARVVPGDADASYLAQKLTGVDICSGNRMPVGGRGLTAAELSTIAGWICGGARND